MPSPLKRGHEVVKLTPVQAIPNSLQFLADGGKQSIELRNDGLPKCRFAFLFENSGDLRVTPSAGFIEKGDFRKVMVERLSSVREDSKLSAGLIRSSLTSSDAESLFIRSPDYNLVIPIVLKGKLPIITCTPDKLEVSKHEADVTLTLKSTNEKRHAFHVICGLRLNCIAKSIYGFLNPGGMATIDLVKKSGRPKDGTIEILFQVADYSITDPAKPFKSGAEPIYLIEVPVSVK